jgi:response regulator RpfG family c-di-GMP phosphodiesterase
VLDSLVRSSCYKAAWPLDKALAHLQEQSGKQFDPTLIDLVFANLENVRALYAS